MINVNFTSIDNVKIISRLLPFWLKGKKAILFLSAILNPLKAVHNNFRAWALEHFIIAHITAQKQSLEWYLTYRLKEHFVHEDDMFEVIQDVGTPENIIFFNRESNSIDTYTAPVFFADEADDTEMIIYSKGEIHEATKIANIYAPAIVQTLSYAESDYIRDINTILRRFMTNFRQYNIIISE